MNYRGDYNGQPLAKIQTKMEMADQFKEMFSHLTDLRNLAICKICN